MSATRLAKYVLLIVVLAAVLWSTKKSTVTQTSADFAASQSCQTQAQTCSASESAPLTQSTVSAHAKEPQLNADTAGVPNTPELKSLQQMTQLFARCVHNDLGVTELLEALEKSKQSPLATRESDADIGDMTIVRTESPPVGTRYFHAQYVGPQAKPGNLQHISFEFKAGPTAMENVIQYLKKDLALEQKPILERPDFMKWNLGDGQVLWVKKLSLADLNEHDPFNAYAPEDVGTIRVAIELDPHYGDEEDSKEDHT